MQRPTGQSAHLVNLDEGELARLTKLADEIGFLSEPLIDYEQHHLQAVGQLTIGETIDGYAIVEQIAAGGKATVYRATQIKVANREVALKLYHRPQQQKNVARVLHDEIATLARLDHPNLAGILDAGTLQDGRTYVVLPFLRGVELDQFCERENLTAHQIAEIFEQIAHAVDELHQLGFVHCDLKPGNILVDERGSPTITDFDAARLSGSLSDIVQGTVGYLAPEQITDNQGSIDARTDLYALGATLYQVLCCRSLFDGRSASGMLVSTIYDTAYPPHTLNAEVPEELSRICMRCLEKSPEERYRSASELATDLRIFIARSNDDAQSMRQARWPIRTITAMLIVILMLLIVMLLGFYGLQKGTDIDARLAASRQLRSTLRALGPDKHLAGQNRERQLSIVTQELRNAALESPNNPELAHESAVAEWELSVYLREIGKYEEAHKHNLQAIAIYEKLLRLDFQPHAVKFDLFHAHHGIAHALENMGETDLCKRHKLKASRLIQELYESSPNNPAIADCYAAQLISHAVAFEADMPLDWSAEQYAKAQNIAKELRKNPEAKVLHWRHRTDASWCLARVYQKMGDAGLAGQAYDDAVLFATEMVDADPDDWGYRYDRVTACLAASEWKYAQGYADDAEQLLALSEIDLSWLRARRPDAVMLRKFESDRMRIIESWK